MPDTAAGYPDQKIATPSVGWGDFQNSAYLIERFLQPMLATPRTVEGWSPVGTPSTVQISPSLQALPQGLALVQVVGAPSVVEIPEHERTARLRAFRAARFLALAEPLERETRVLSNPNQMLRHPSVAALKEIGAADVVPRILRRIDEYPVVWMTVLNDLTGENPVPERDWGRVLVMVRSWKDWGRARGYLD